MFALAALAGCALSSRPKDPGPPTGELLLDMANPVIAVKIGKVPLHLRVALEQKRLIELNPAAANRLAANPPDENFRFEGGFTADVGRERLKGIAAPAPITINRRNLIVLVSSHGRDCCPGVDGEIGIGLLPYATIRFVRAGAPAPDRSADFLMDDSDEQGPQSAVQVGRNQIFLQFALGRSQTVAASSAGAIIAQRHGGQLGGQGTTIGAVGVSRPTSLLTFRQPVDIAGFLFKTLMVRTADYAGKFEFPVEAADPDDIVVRKRIPQQKAWPVVLIGKDRLDACGEALYETTTGKLTLRCAISKD